MTARSSAYFISKKTKGARFTEVERDLKQVRITCEDIQKSDYLKKKSEGHRGFRNKAKLRSGKTWTEERRKRTEIECRNFGQQLTPEEEKS